MQIERLKLKRREQAILRRADSAAVGFFEYNCREAHDARSRIDTRQLAIRSSRSSLTVLIASHNPVSHDVEQGRAMQLLQPLLCRFSFAEQQRLAR